MLVNEQRLIFAAQSFRVDRAELRRMLELLQERANGAVELEISHVVLPDKNQQEINAFHQALRDASVFFITITGLDGSQLNGTIAEIFDSPNFPASVATVFVDSATKMRNQNYYPRNSLKLFIDFRKPAIFDFNLMPSHATANESAFTVNGQDVTWVRGVYHEIDSFVRTHMALAGWLHRHSIYDMLLFPVGLPVALWIAYRCSGIVQKVDSPFLQAAIYIYLWFATLWAFRALFHYARWLWPLIEYRQAESRIALHRTFWSLLFSAVFCSLVYDIAKKLLGWP